MPEFRDIITPDEAAWVASVFGSWPSLHDAEVLRVKLDRDGQLSLTMTIKVIPYDPDGTKPVGMLDLRFEQIADMELSDFNEQNVLSDLTFEVDGERMKAIISTSYGLFGHFLFERVRVLRAQPVGDS